MGAQLSASMLVKMIDGVTGPARVMTASIRGIGSAVSALSGRAAAVPIAIGKQVGRQAKALSEASSRMSAAATPAAFAGGYGFFRAYEYEKAMNTMEALGELTKAQRQEADAFFRSISEKSPRSMKELAQVTNELLRGGLEFKAAMGALKSTMDLAIYGDIEPKAASEIAINALNQFRMPMKTVEEAQASMRKVADLIAYAANKSATDVRLMGETFKYAAPMATSLGMSMEELSAAAMIMANSGIKGSEAGVAIRSAMVRLLRPTKEMNATLARLGINLNDFKKKGSDITARNIVDVLHAEGVDATRLGSKIQAALDNKELKSAPQRMVSELSKIISDGLGSSLLVDKAHLAGVLSDALSTTGSSIDLTGFLKAVADKAGPDVASAMTRILDVRQAGRLITLTAGDLRAMINGIEKESAGYAERGAETMLGGIVGAVNRIINAIDQLFTKLGQSGFFDDLANGLTRVTAAIKSMSEFDKNLLRFATYGALALASAGAISAAISAAGAAAAIAANPIAWLAASLAALAYFNWDGIKAFSEGFSKGFWDNLKIPPETIQSWQRLKAELSTIGIDIESWRSLGETLGGVVAAGVNFVSGAFRRLFDFLRLNVVWVRMLKEELQGISLGGIGRGLLNGITGAKTPATPAAPAQTPPGRAKGGPVGGGMPYIVGERGPELFVPGTSGRIVPNHALAGRGRAGGGVSVSFGDIVIQGASNAAEIADQVGAHLEAKIRALTSGLQADLGYTS